MEKQKEQAPVVHDGVSPILITETEENAQFQQLWDYLVPPSGRAGTAQGEIIRIAGRVRHELMNAFNEDDIKSAELLARLLTEAGDKGCAMDSLCAALCACAVAWVGQNPEVIAPLEADYSR